MLAVYRVSMHLLPSLPATALLSWPVTGCVIGLAPLTDTATALEPGFRCKRQATTMSNAPSKPPDPLDAKAMVRSRAADAHGSPGMKGSPSK